MASRATEEVELIPKRLAWKVGRATGPPAETATEHVFCTDDLLVYDPYFGDFGPLNMSQICRYCKMLNQKLNDESLLAKRIVHFCKPHHDYRANSVLLLCAWNVLYNNKSPAEAWRPFAILNPKLVPYRDASMGQPCFDLTVEHCLHALKNGVAFGWLDPETFDSKTYDFYERVENGDMNWIVPGKFLAFSGPTETPIAYVDGVKTNTPEKYFEFFRKNNITGVVRFNNKVYNRKKFLDAGFNHHDMYFPDGSNPPDSITKRFMEVAESEKGALAIHCKAGLGRTGTLIGLYVMKHYGITYSEFIGWTRMCRPGSVIGPQQLFLRDMEKRMHSEGVAFREKKGNGKGLSVTEGLSQLSIGSPTSNGSPPGSPGGASSSGGSPPKLASRAKSGFSIGGVSVSRSLTSPKKAAARK